MDAREVEVISAARAYIDAQEACMASTHTADFTRRNNAYHALKVAVRTHQQPAPQEERCPDCRRPIGEPHQDWCPMQDA